MWGRCLWTQVSICLSRWCPILPQQTFRHKLRNLMENCEKILWLNVLINVLNIWTFLDALASPFISVLRQEDFAPPTKSRAPERPQNSYCFFYNRCFCVMWGVWLGIMGYGASAEGKFLFPSSQPVRKSKRNTSVSKENQQTELLSKLKETISGSWKLKHNLFVTHYCKKM